MDKSSLVINRTGVYLFHSPTKVSLQLNKELLLLLCVPNRRLAGFLLVDASTHASDVVGLLDSLVRKMNREFQVSTPSIQAKFLGMSNNTLPIKPRIQKWLGEHSIEVVAEDTGRNVCRTVFVDCESGLAGVSYAENYLVSYQEDSVGLKRTNNKMHKALVISSSKKNISLARKLGEKHSDWLIESTTDLKTFFASEPNLSSYEGIFLFDDLKTKFEKLTKAFLAATQAAYPKTNLYWCGKRPKFADKCISLPSTTGTQLTKFKSAFNNELETIAGHLTGTVLPFPGPHKKRA